MTRQYLDVGVVRIGEYVTRVRRLQGIRGASSAVTAATATTVVAGVDGVQAHDEAGEADGVLHLVLDSGVDAATAGRQVLVQVRRRLPGADLEASWGAGESYAEARTRIYAQRSAGDGLRWFPATAEAPMLTPCDDCGSRPALARPGEGDVITCPDCRQREDLRGRSGAAQRLLEQRLPGGTFVKELRGLPRGGDAGTRHSNHIALVMADGNGVGALFTALSSGHVNAGTRLRVSRELTTATREALVASARAVQQPDGFVPVVPVVLGGDDVAVLVAAHAAWRFTRELLTTFEAEIRQRLAGLAAVADVEPSLTAGIVVQHYASPVADGFGVAQDLMRQAKRSESGRAAAVAWVDLTTEGSETGLAHRPALRLSVVLHHGAALTSLAALPAGTRKELERLVGMLPEDDAAGYLRRHAQRLGIADQAAPFLSGAGSGIELEVALDLARWWR